MTRVTNFGRKRTYVDSGLGPQADPETTYSLQDERANDDPTVEEAAVEAVPPPKKKRKRTKMSKRDGNAAAKAAIAGGDAGAKSQDVDIEEKGEEVNEIVTPKPALSKSAKKKKRERERKTKSTHPLQPMINLFYFAIIKSSICIGDSASETNR